MEQNQLRPLGPREQAVRLRLAGLSRSQIKQALGVRSSKLLTSWLGDTPPAAWTTRPNAKDDVHDRAVSLRLEGRSYNEIRGVLGVSKSTLSLWLRNVPLSDEHRLALDERRSTAWQRGLDTRRARRVRRRQAIVDGARQDIADISERELFMAGVVAYWAEGSKNKPWRSSQVVFTNSDAGMIRLFLSWLRLLGVDDGDLVFRVAIHESADVDKSLRHWAEVLGVPENRLSPTTLKHHNPKTVRRNLGQEYHGCLSVRVRRSSDLNLLIAGWWESIAGAAGTMRPSSGVV